MEPSDIDFARGKSFAQWLKKSCEAMGTNPSQLAKKSGISSSYMYDLANDGVKVIDGVPVYKRPSEEKILLIASSLGISPTDGLLAAGYGPDVPPPSPDPLASLPPDIQLKLASLVMDIGRLRGPEVVTLTESDVATLPVMGFAGAVGENFDVFASENIIDKRTVSRSMIGNRDPERCFIVKVRGNCLAGSHIIDGDDVTCVSADSAEDGDIVLVVHEENVVLKRYREEQGENDLIYCWLETDEADGSKKIYDVEDEARIIAVAIGSSRDFK
jgi:SOS-response transcriptional repressor LexA